jgi:hypothetical protein
MSDMPMGVWFVLNVAIPIVLGIGACVFTWAALNGWPRLW